MIHKWKYIELLMLRNTQTQSQVSTFESMRNNPEIGILLRRRAAKRPGGASYSAYGGFKRVKCVCVSVCHTIPREPPKGTSTDNATFGCQLASTYLALDFWGPRKRKNKLICQCQGVSVGSENFMIFHVFVKSFLEVLGTLFVVLCVFGHQK